MKYKINALILTVSMLFTACGGGGGGSDSSPTTALTKTGVFVDAPVRGLEYKTKTQSGFTNEKGEFKYVEGEEVEFLLGDISFGKVKASPLMTPYTMAKDSDLNNPSNKATNIALLLQNFDGDRADGNLLDVTKLQGYDFEALNLDVNPVDIKNKIDLLFTNPTFDNYRDTLDDVTVDETIVNSKMKIQIESFIKNDDFLATLIVGKSFVIANISNMFGYKKSNSISFTTTIMNLVYNGTTYQIPYILEEGYIKLDFRGIDDDNPTEYIAILNITDDEILSCSENKTLEEAKQCTVANSSLLNASGVDAFISQKNASLTNILQNKTKITQLSDLEDKMLYQLDGYHGASGDIDYLSQIGIKITSSNELKRFWHWETDVSVNLESYPDSGTYHYSVSFENEKLSINGVDNDGDTVADSYDVYKYSLTNYTATATELAKIFDGDEILNVLNAEQSFIFSGGNMYCQLLWDECWIDEEAMNSIKNQLPYRSRTNTQPVANAGANQTVTLLSTVMLDASLSTDTELDSLTYTWTITSKPDSSNATLSNSLSSRSSFTADKEGTYSVSLVVNDGILNSITDTLIITVTAPTSSSSLPRPPSIPSL